MEQLDDVLNYLKKNKSQDPFGYANEIFRPEVAGSDLKRAILKLMNRIKFQQLFPEVLEYCDISSYGKEKIQEMILRIIEGYFR